MIWCHDFNASIFSDRTRCVDERTRPVKDTTPYEGKTLEFKVIKLDRRRNNVVLSRRAVIELSQGEERAKLLETLTEGAVVQGVVKNITDYGAFVDLGGIDGLLHITDMAWRRVRHPTEVLQVGQEITAKVLKFDQEKNRVCFMPSEMRRRSSSISRTMTSTSSPRADTFWKD